MELQSNQAAAPLFYWNGLKDAKGEKLQPAWYSGSRLNNHPDGTITIYAKRYRSFSRKVHACLAVVNNSDAMTDYFENDRIRVVPEHPIYPEVKDALAKQEAHQAKLRAKRVGGAA